MAKAPLKVLIRRAEEMLGLLCAEWEKGGLSSKAVAKKSKPFTDAIRQAREELNSRPTPNQN